MRAAKFQTKVTDLSHEELDKVKAKHGVPPRLNSCHTALVGGTSSKVTSPPTT